MPAVPGWVQPAASRGAPAGLNAAAVRRAAPALAARGGGGEGLAGSQSRPAGPCRARTARRRRWRAARASERRRGRRPGRRGHRPARHRAGRASRRCRCHGWWRAARRTGPGWVGTRPPPIPRRGWPPPGRRCWPPRAGWPAATCRFRRGGRTAARSCCARRPIRPSPRPPRFPWWSPARWTGTAVARSGRPPDWPGPRNRSRGQHRPGQQQGHQPVRRLMMTSASAGRHWRAGPRTRTWWRWFPARDRC